MVIVALEHSKGAQGISTEQADIARQGQAGALVLLFPSGRRPSASVIEKIISKHKHVSVSHDPSDSASTARGADDGDWLELLCEGLTFDLVGLAPCAHATLAQLSHFIDISDPNAISASEAVVLNPGPHLAGGEASLPIVRTLMALGATLGSALPDLLAFA